MAFFPSCPAFSANSVLASCTSCLTKSFASSVNSLARPKTDLGLHVAVIIIFSLLAKTVASCVSFSRPAELGNTPHRPRAGGSRANRLHSQEGFGRWRKSYDFQKNHL